MKYAFAFRKHRLFFVGALISLSGARSLASSTEIIGTVAGHNVYREAGDRSAFFFRSGMTIDADGAPRAYHQNSALALDYLANAGHQGNWWALITDTGKPSGTPLRQKSTDPAPGFYISTTTLEDQHKLSTDPKRYVDAATIPYMVLPSSKRFGAKVGDYAMVINTATGRSCGAVFGDHGGGSHLGEGSIALASALGIPSNPKHGGTTGNVVYLVFPGSRQGWPKAKEQVTATATRLYSVWGGWNRLEPLLPRQ